MKDDFRKYATKHLGMSSMVLDDVLKVQSQYLNPYILEERQLNVTQMDVFSRLMMDRIIFLGTQIDDYTAKPVNVSVITMKEEYTVLAMELFEGRNRQIRKMCEQVELDIITLRRISLGSLKLGDLRPGKWRYLTRSEIDALMS